MFYQENLDLALRFGDVLKGFVIATPSISDPLKSKEYNLEINHPDYCVIISPCCSIRQKVITLSPLIPILGNFFSNPFFEQDLTRINRKMEPKETVEPSIWENRFSEEERMKRLKEGKTYALYDLFIYEQHSLFSKYKLNVKGKGEVVTNYYMIDFSHTHKIHCDKIISNIQSPLEFKCLQLSIEARSELRDKLTNYYGRIPEEDKILDE